MRMLLTEESKVKLHAASKCKVNVWELGMSNQSGCLIYDRTELLMSRKTKFKWDCQIQNEITEEERTL